MSFELNIQEKILLAGLALMESGKEKFSAEDLVVMAWTKYPESFGLLGYLDENSIPLYPNSNRIYAEIMGSKPLRKNGYLRKVGSKMYQITEAGRLKVQSIKERNLNVQPEKLAIARQEIEFIKKLNESNALKKYRAGGKEEISFFDACGFWGISPASNVKDLWSHFAEIESVINTVLKYIKTKEVVRLSYGSGDFTINDVKNIENTHKILIEKFSKEIELIKKRTHD